MLITEFDYELPTGLIAQYPLAVRDSSRMLVLKREEQGWKDRRFADFLSFLHEGDVLVVNNTRVFPARLAGRRFPSGGQIEIFLIREIEPGIWEALTKPARRLRLGSKIIFGDGTISGTVIDLAEAGRRIVRLESIMPLDEAIDNIGSIPLPPYIKRTPEIPFDDRERYQTIYAANRGAIAAPTAGLHFTPELLDQIQERGIRIAPVTLHVGYGTFEPVKVVDLAEHQVAAEHFEISNAAANTINECRLQGGRVVAVGTTTVRALESAADADGRVKSGSGSTTLTITPGYIFRTIDSLLTNFHLPRSSLLLLIASFAGFDLTMKAYRHAVEAEYRFYSYGDCMLII